MDVKNIENEIMKEAKVEEKVLKHALKDLSVTEKAEAETYKVHSLQVLVQYYLLYNNLQAVIKANISLEKSEKKEQSALGKVQEATHAHDIAVSSVHEAQNDLEVGWMNNKSKLTLAFLPRR